MSKVPDTMLSPKRDFVFKRLFGDTNHLEHLARFLQAALTLPLGLDDVSEIGKA